MQTLASVSNLSLRGDLPTFKEWLRRQGYEQLTRQSEGDSVTYWVTPGDRERVNDLSPLQADYQRAIANKGVQEIADDPTQYAAIQKEIAAKSAQATAGANRHADTGYAGIDKWQYAQTGFIPIQELGTDDPNAQVWEPGSWMRKTYGNLTYAVVWSAIYGPNWDFEPGVGLHVPPGTYENPFGYYEESGGFHGFMLKAIPTVIMSLIPAGVGTVIKKAWTESQKREAKKDSQHIREKLTHAKENLFAMRLKQDRLRNWIERERIAVDSVLEQYKEALARNLSVQRSDLVRAMQSGQLTPASARSEYEGMIRQSSNDFSNYGRELLAELERRFDIEKART